MKKYECKCLIDDNQRIIVTEEFVRNNNFKINVDMAKDILKNGRDTFFGFEMEVAANFISLDDAKEILKEKDPDCEISKEDEDDYLQITDINEAVQDFLDYMVFAWEKAMDERGISASRSIVKLSAWMEILGRSDIVKILNNSSLYNPYGRPALRKACEKLGIECPDDL